MVQTLYGIIALALAMMLALNLMRTITGTQRKMVLNEVATQVTSISVDMMEHLSTKAFDDKTDESGLDLATTTFPIVTTATALTPPSGFGSVAERPLPALPCPHPDFYSVHCDDIDDFDGMTMTRTIDGIPYAAEITVRYVNETDPNQVSSTQTFAKEVVVEITSPYLRIGSTPISATFSRVFTYHRRTS